MKKQILISLCCFVLFQSCCFRQGDEIARYEYSEEQRALIPYENGQSINFIHSNGYTFQLEAEIVQAFYSNQEHCEDYQSYESYAAHLHSEIPLLDLEIRLPYYSEDFNSEELYISYTSIPYTEVIENFEIGTQSYSNVYHFENDESSRFSDVYYSYEMGYIKLIYQNGDYVQIQP